MEVAEGFAYRDQLGCGAFGFRSQDTHLRHAFNRVLNQLREITRLVEPFAFAEVAQAARGLTAEDLCAS